MKQTTAAIITAAGMSSRMKAFKPMLPIGSNSISEKLIRTFKASQINSIYVVTGFRSQDLMQHLNPYEVSFIKNEKYFCTQMLDSIRLGLQALPTECERVLICPVDLPLIKKSTIKKLLDSSTQVSIPTFQNRKGHPILLDCSKVPEILAYRGDFGLKGALESIETDNAYIPVADKGILMDADTQDAFGEILNMSSDIPRKTCSIYPSYEICMRLMIQHQTPEVVMLHGAATAELTGKIVDALKKKGFTLDAELAYYSALLHDIARHYHDHPTVGANWIRQEGYRSMAKIVEKHMELDSVDPVSITEAEIVFYADKRMNGRKLVTLEERFLNHKPSATNTKALVAFKKRYLQAQIIESKLVRMLNGWPSIGDEH